MANVLSILRLLLFFTAMGGYVCYACGRLKLKVEFAPAVVFSGIIAVLTLAGYLNVLLFTAWAIYLGGFALLILYLVKKKIKGAFHEKPALIGAVFALVLTAFAVFRLKGARLTFYDDFSHWGTIVKEMLIYNRLPNAQSTAISFRSYPPGSALFIYFVNLMTGVSESKMLIAQALLNISFLCAFFGIVKSTARIWTQLVLAAAAAFILFTTPLDNLWVDTLLAASGVATFAVLFAYRNDLRRASLYALPIMIASVMIKNDGVAFALANLMFLFYLGARQGGYPLGLQDRLRKYVYPGVALLAVGIAFVLWTRHWEYVFPTTPGKHVLSISSYVKIFGGKKPEDIWEITRQFFRRTLEPATPSTMYFLAANGLTVLFSLAARFLRHPKAAVPLKALLYADILFLLYMTGMLAMYLFSMPTSEALGLAAYPRYANTITSYHLAVLAVSYATLLENGFRFAREKCALTKPSLFRWHIYGAALAAAVCLLGTIPYSVSYSNPSGYAQSIPAQFDRIAGENWKGYTNEKYCVYYAKDQSQPASTLSYINFITLHKMFPASSVTMTTFDEEDLFKNLEKCTKLIILGADTPMKKFMADYTDKSDCRGVYPVKSTFFAND